MIKPGDSTTLSVLRAGLLLIFVIGVFGTATELFLIGHTEEWWQWTPLVLMGLSVGILLWHLFSAGYLALRVFRGVMTLFLIAGLVGMFLHFKGNVEFELEMYPHLKGLELFSESMQGATPALAPGTMLHLGLIGWLYTIRHPRFRPPVSA